jgi:hypothetical protein
MPRICGACTLCCKLLPVRELQKPANTRCEHQSAARGCRIYHRRGFPASCAVWSCRWLNGHDTADMLRPDRAGYVLDVVPDAVQATNNETGEKYMVTVVQVWVAPGAEPLHDPRLLRYAERQAEDGVALLLRYGSNSAVAVFPPKLATDGGWHIVGGDSMQRVETKTGNMLLDALRDGDA